VNFREVMRKPTISKCRERARHYFYSTPSLVLDQAVVSRIFIRNSQGLCFFLPQTIHDYGKMWGERHEIQVVLHWPRTSRTS